MRKLAAFPLLLVALFLAACGGGRGPDPNDASFWQVTLRQAAVSPVLVNHALAVGENRLQVGLLDREQVPILRAQVRLQLYRLDGPAPVLVGEREARYVSLRLSFVEEHYHPPGTPPHTHGPGEGDRVVEVGESGVYVAQFAFDAPGTYGLAVSGTLPNGRRFGPLPYLFNVLPRTPEPMVGDPAPPSHQPTLRDVADVRELSTDAEPIADLYTLTVAEAVRSGRPTVIAFATPAFCTSRTCGPVLQAAVKPLYERYRGQANFIHIEPYRLREAREGIGLCPVPVFNREMARLGQGLGRCPPLPADQLPPPQESWNLETEPWVFVLDRQGRVAAKFEGIVSAEEVEAALRAVLAR